MTPSIINTNNKNLNIKYNERLVKDIRKDEREKVILIIEKKLDEMMNMIHGDTDWDMGFDCAIETITKELNKLNENKTK